MKLIDSDSYLFTINEASRLLRMNRQKFLREYIEPGIILITKLEDNRIMIQHSEIKRYLQEKTGIIIKSEE